MIARFLLRPFASASLCISSPSIAATATTAGVTVPRGFSQQQIQHSGFGIDSPPSSQRFPNQRRCFRRFGTFTSTFSSSSSSNNGINNHSMPAPPYTYVSPEAPVLDLSDLGARLTATEDQRQEALDQSRTFQKSLKQAQHDLEQNRGNAREWIRKLESSLAGALSSETDDPTGRRPRVANWNHRVEDLCRFQAMVHFLETATMLPPSACAASSDSTWKATDEEYLAGSCMGLAQELSRYALGRATARDVASVQQARDVIAEILDYLLKFDFRNGFLRRKYDGTKYALKAAETLLYELSVTGASLEASGQESSSAEETNESQAKKPRLEEPPSSETSGEPSESAGAKPSIQDELEALRLRMEHRDGLRETLIKTCRDGQKAAKQAIYALHRGDVPRAHKLIEDCETCITTKLLPIVEEEPPLRNSCFGDVMEEYAEARLFAAWLVGDTDGDDAAAAPGRLLLPHEFPVQLEPDEYLGGLCDLTGEIGRKAVQAGTERDAEGVRNCLEANAAILRAVSSLDRTPPRIHKKMDHLRRSVSKIERMMYELSLSRAAGMKVSSEVVAETTTTSTGGSGE